MSSRPLVVVAGAMANKPGNGGEAWVRLNWVRGLADLGLDVRFVEELDPGACTDATGRACNVAESAHLQWFNTVLGDFGLEDRAALLCDGQVLGSSPADLHRWAREAALLVDISGHLAGSPLLDEFATRLFVDLDPGYTQIWHHRGLPGTQLDRHHVYATVGLALGTAGCGVPTAGHRWLPVPPFVVPGDVALAPPSQPGAALSTVTTWRQSYGPIEWEGTTHGSKHHAFRRFAALPAHVDTAMEIATRFGAADDSDRRLLVDHGWRIADPAAAAATPQAFQRYVARSAGEWSVAQGVYVDLASGWLSDRTVRYLATGRPAIVEHTGLPAHLLPGAGLLTFTDVDEAVEHIRRVEREPTRHALAAQQLAEQHLSSRVVLPPLLEACGIGVGALL